MDWNSPIAGYVIASYAISATCILAMLIWCLSRDTAARKALQRLNE